MKNRQWVYVGDGMLFDYEMHYRQNCVGPLVF